MEASGQLHGPVALPPEKERTSTHWIGRWVGLRAVLGAVMKRKIPSLRRESKPRTMIVQPIAQRYHGSFSATDATVKSPRLGLLELDSGISSKPDVIFTLSRVG
jgi:hypothetical protein